MRSLAILAVIASLAAAQQLVDIAPLQPPDMNSPYASPRDAARHRLRQTMSDLEARHDPKLALRGFADALVRDSSYALAAFDVGIAFAEAGKWDDAIAAFEEANRLDPSFDSETKPQLERLRLVATLDKTAEGQRRRRYDEALLPLLDRLPKLPAAQKFFALAELGRLNPRRWEAPALMAAVANNYEVAAKFLTIAEATATESTVRTALQRAKLTAEREVKYSTARNQAEAAADAGEHAKAAELFESAWTTIPARATDGLNSAAEYLLENDTAKAAILLTKVRQTGDPKLTARAAAMLQHLEPVEPAAKASSANGSPVADLGSVDPPNLLPLLPQIDRAKLELLARPLPKFRSDPEPPALLASFQAEPAPSELPALAEPAIAAEFTWRDIQSAAAQRLVPVSQASGAATETVELAQGSRAKPILIASDPSGAQIFVDNSATPACRTPCRLTLQTGTHKMRLKAEGFKDDERTVTIKTTNDEVVVLMEVVRGLVTIELPTGAALRINDRPVEAAAMPAQFALTPGLYRFSSTIGATRKDRVLTVKPGANLRISLAP